MLDWNIRGLSEPLGRLECFGEVDVPGGEPGVGLGAAFQALPPH